MAAEIFISWEDITDSRSEQAKGADFEDGIAEHIDSGDVVRVEMPNGTMKTFDDTQDWHAWYQALGENA